MYSFLVMSFYMYVCVLSCMKIIYKIVYCFQCFDVGINFLRWFNTHSRQTPKYIFFEKL